MRLPQGFRKQGNGYECRFTYKRHRYSVYGSTIKEATEKKSDLIRKLDEGIKIDAAALTISEYWQEHLSNLTVSKNTIKTYKKKFKVVLKHIGDIKVCELDRRDVLKLQKALTAQYCSSTVNYRMGMLKKLMREAVAARITSYNPCECLNPVKRIEEEATETIHRALTKEELQTFFAFAYKKNSWYTHIFEFMLNTGMRVGEACALTYKDIDKEFIHIRKTVSDKEIGKTTKTTAGRRDVPLNDDIRRIIAAQKRQIYERYGMERVQPSSRIFIQLTNPDKILTSTCVDHAIESVILTAKDNGHHIEKFTSHAFRDTFATMVAAQGVMPQTLKTILGHKKIAITMDKYVHTLPNQKIEAMNSIDMAL